MDSIPACHLSDLIIVACHAAFHKNIVKFPEHPEEESIVLSDGTVVEQWTLLDFQRGEPPFFIEHIRRGVVLAAHNLHSLLLFSGGAAKENGGPRTEAETYYDIAKHYEWWLRATDPELLRDVERRTEKENYARDSFENLLYSISRFNELTGVYPRTITVISWSFKRKRFDMHRAAIRFPRNRYRFVGFNEPFDLETALRGEDATTINFMEDRYGFDPASAIGRKRLLRSYPHHPIPYRNNPDLKGLFEFIEQPRNRRRPLPKNLRLPWDE